MRTNIFQNKKKYIISLLKQTKIVQMLNVWSEGFSKNNKFYFSAILRTIKKCRGRPWYTCNRYNMSGRSVWDLQGEPL